MNAERFVARDTKSALEKVKAKLGADAFILSTNRNDSGIEIAAISGKSVEEGAAQVVNSSSVGKVNEITLGYLDRELKALRDSLQCFGATNLARGMRQNSNRFGS